MQEKYAITVCLAINTDMKTSSFHQSRKLIHIQSVSTNSRRFHSTVGMCYRPKIILYELQTQAALQGYLRPVVCRGLNTWGMCTLP